LKPTFSSDASMLRVTLTKTINYYTYQRSIWAHNFHCSRLRIVKLVKYNFKNLLVVLVLIVRI